MLVEVSYCPAVGDDVSFEIPLVTDDVLQIGVTAAWLAVGPVIGAHYGLDLCFLYACLESGHVCLIEILIVACSVELMP